MPTICQCYNHCSIQTFSGDVSVLFAYWLVFILTFYLFIYSCLYIAKMHYVNYLIIMILDYKWAVMSIVRKWWCFGLRCSSGVDVAACRLDLLQPIGQKPEIKLPCSTFLLHSAPRTAAPAFHLRPSFTHCQASQRACQDPWDRMCLESQSLSLRH